MKWCTGTCGRELPLEAFDLDPRVRDGRTSRCRVCRRFKHRHARRRRYQRDREYREAVKADNRRKYQENRETLLASQWRRDEAKRHRARMAA